MKWEIFSGIFPCPPRWQQKTHQRRTDRQPYHYGLLLWSAVLWLTVTFSVLSYTDDYIRFYYSQLRDLEFFTAVTGIFRLSVFLQGPFTAGYLIYQCKFIPPLLKAFSEAMSGIATVAGRPWTRLLRTVACLGLAWTGICAAMGATRSVEQIALIDETIWKCDSNKQMKQGIFLKKNTIQLLMGNLLKKLNNLNWKLVDLVSFYSTLFYVF